MFEIKHLYDAIALQELRQKLSVETNNMMFEPDEVPSERDTSIQLNRLRISTYGTTFGAYIHSDLVGFITLERGRVKRNSGTGVLVMGVLQKWSGQGIGHKLMSSVINWAKNEGMYRLSFDVRADNYRALELYTRLGFETEGRMRRAVLIDGKFVDKYLMAMLL